MASRNNREMWVTTSLLSVTRKCDEQGLFHPLYLPQCPGDLVAIHPGHTDVHKHHFRLKASCYFNSFWTIVDDAKNMAYAVAILF